MFFGWSKEFAKGVVEVYNYDGNENYEAVGEALKGGRVTACVTDSDGKFSFSGLKAGRYLLRLGTRESAGMNEVSAILHVTPNGSGKRIEIKLPPGT